MSKNNLSSIIYFHNINLSSQYIFIEYGRASLISCVAVSSLQDMVYLSAIQLRDAYPMRTLRARAHWPLCSTTCGRSLLRTRAH